MEYQNLEAKIPDYNSAKAKPRIVGQMVKYMAYVGVAASLACNPFAGNKEYNLYVSSSHHTHFVENLSGHDSTVYYCENGFGTNYVKNILPARISSLDAPLICVGDFDKDGVAGHDDS